MKIQNCLLTLSVLALLRLPAPAADGTAKDNEKLTGLRTPSPERDGKWHVSRFPRDLQPPVVTPGPRSGQNAPAPSDAEWLFAGHDLSKWQNDQGARRQMER